MKQKTHIQKIIIIALIFNIFFVLAHHTNAEIKISDSIFDFSEDTVIGYVDKTETPSVMVGGDNKVKVCKDVACSNPGIINFEISENLPLTIDTLNGLSGRVWGDELGWITFDPPYGGVFFGDAETGLLRGTAWSETSGVINFSVTGQKVVINPETGDWSGWAWASGPYGGWIKFDCNDNSCVHTTWRGPNYKSEKQDSPAPEESSTQNENKEDNGISLGTKTKTIVGQIASYTFNSIYSSLKNTSNYVAKEIKKINGSAFTISYNSIKNFSYKMSDSKNQFLGAIGETSKNIFSHFSRSFANLYTGTVLTLSEKSKIMGTDIKIFRSNITSLFSKTGSLVYNVDKIIFKEINKINGSTFSISYNNIKEILAQNSLAIGNFVLGMINIKYDAFDKLGEVAYNSFNFATIFLSNILFENFTPLFM